MVAVGGAKRECLARWKGTEAVSIRGPHSGALSSPFLQQQHGKLQFLLHHFQVVFVVESQRDQRFRAFGQQCERRAVLAVSKSRHRALLQPVFDEQVYVSLLTEPSFDFALIADGNRVSSMFLNGVFKLLSRAIASSSAAARLCLGRSGDGNVHAGLDGRLCAS
jgi:hypothetical protein